MFVSGTMPNTARSMRALPKISLGRRFRNPGAEQTCGHLFYPSLERSVVEHL